MEIELKGGRLRLPLLRVAGDEGFSLELEGEVDDAASRPKGSAARPWSAPTPAPAIAPLAELLGIPEAFRPDARRAQAMVPLRLAGSMAFGARTPTSADLVLDGEVNGAGVKLNARLDGGPAGWRSGPADVTGLIEGNDAQAVAALLAPGRILGPRRQPGLGPRGGQGHRRAERGAGLARLRGRRRSRAQLPRTAGRRRRPATPPPATSTSRPRTARASPRSPDWRRPCGSTACPIAGSLKFAVDRSTIALDRLALNIGGSDVKGQLSIATVGDRRRVEARLDVDELSVAKLLGLLQDQRLAVAAAAETAVSGRQSVWSGRALRRRHPRRLRGQHQAQRQAPPAGRRHGPQPGQPRHRPRRAARWR